MAKTIYHRTDQSAGTVEVETTSGSSDSTTTPLNYKNPYKFTGKELDPETALYYYGARYYNPALGRFLSTDPWAGNLTDPQSLNKYSYVRNNPLKYVDPTGKSWYNPLTWTLEGTIETFEGATQAVMDVGDTLTFGLYSDAFEGVQDAADRINEEGFNLDTALNAGKEIIGGSIGITGGALAESVIIGKGNILRKQLFGQTVDMMQPSVSTKFQKNSNVPQILRGKPVKDVIKDLKNGKISTEDLPIGYVKINDKNIVINNRSFSAAKYAKIKPNFRNITGIKGAYEQGKNLIEQSGGKVFDKLKLK